MITIYKKLIASVLALVSVPVVSIAQSMDIDLSKAIEIALAENPTIKVADKDVQLKEIADKEAWQALLPTADINLSASHSIQVAQVKMGGNTFKMGQDGTTTATGALTVALPVFVPTVYQNMKMTKQDIELAQEKARSSRIDLVNQVTKAYYGALLAKDSYDVMVRSYNVSKENYEIVEKKYSVGSVSEYDKISAEVQMRSMNSTMVSAQTGLTLSLLKLKVLMGINPEIDVNITDNLKAYESQLTLANTEASKEELANNSAIRQLDMTNDILGRTEKLLKTNFMPTVALAFNGQYQSISNDNFNFFGYDYSPSATLQLTVSIPVFHASNFTKLKSNKLQRLQLADTRENSVRQLEMAMNTYRKNMQTTLVKIESDRQAVSQATKAVNISSKRYEVGRGTILEVNQSETALTQAELTYCQSVYDYLSNKADLDMTLGRGY